jgi:hypothetical protein
MEKASVAAKLRLARDGTRWGGRRGRWSRNRQNHRRYLNSASAPAQDHLRRSGRGALGC